MVPLKQVNRFWEALEISLTDYEINLILISSAN